MAYGLQITNPSSNLVISSDGVGYKFYRLLGGNDVIQAGSKTMYYDSGTGVYYGWINPWIVRVKVPVTGMQPLFAILVGTDTITDSYAAYYVGNDTWEFQIFCVSSTNFSIEPTEFQNLTVGTPAGAVFLPITNAEISSYSYTAWQLENGLTDADRTLAINIANTYYLSNSYIGFYNGADRYGLYRKPDAEGLKFWTNYTRDNLGSNYLNMATPFYNLTSGTDDTRSRTSSKTFDGGTGIGDFYDKPYVGYGLSLYNSSGNLTFTTDVKPLFINQYLTCTAESVSYSPAGGWSDGTGNLYAYGQSTPWTKYTTPITLTTWGAGVFETINGDTGGILQQGRYGWNATNTHIRRLPFFTSIPSNRAFDILLDDRYAEVYSIKPMIINYDLVA